MAATATAPAKAAATRPEPATYIFRLTKKFPEFFQGSSPMAARQSVPTSDTILWPYVSGKPVGWKSSFDPAAATYQARSIRYISGSPTIFVDEQEAHGNDAYKRNEQGLNPLLDNPANSDDLTFQRGEIRVGSHNRSLVSYLWCRNDCKNQYDRASQPYLDNEGKVVKSRPGKRMRPLNIQYELLNPAETDEIKVAFGKFRDKAYEVAKTARTEDMIPHAKYLNIQFNHSGTDELKDMAAIKEEYVDYALAKPEDFLKSFQDPRVKIIYQIRELVQGDDPQITFLKSPGQAHWINTGAFIAQMDPNQEPIEFLAGFSMTKEGEEFANNLRAFK